MTTLRGGLLVPADQSAYAALVEAHPDALVYHTPGYLAAIAEIVGSAGPMIHGVWRDGRLVAAMPGFLSICELGRVYNAGPYFGSHGDVLLAEGEDESAVDILADVMAQSLAEMDAVNVVAHPLAPRAARLAGGLGLRAWDSRIGQISSLPRTDGRDEALVAILAACGQKARNLVRKGLRQGFSIAASTDEADWAELAAHHRFGMARIGGRAKEEAEFAALRHHLGPMARLYVARAQGAFAGGLLLLVYRDWIEYFTPVAVEEFRSQQVLSALIAHAMCEGVLEGRRYWNWGGTWVSQGGVYHFKQGWGAVDRPYAYYGAVHSPGLTEMPPSVLLQRFPYFYVRPFG